MTTEERVLYWVELAEYDMDTADAMFVTKRWLYVGFMCHQVLEKILKAYWCSTQSEEPPYVHNLLRLAEGSRILDSMSDIQKRFLSEMIPMNIEARYPTYKEEIAKTLTPERCGLMIRTTKEMMLWIKSKL